MTRLDDALKALDANAVLEAISTHPNLDTTTELTEAYVRVVHANPPQASAVTDLLVDLVDKSGRVPKIHVFYKDRNPPEEVQENFSEFFQREVFEKIRDLLNDDEDTVVSPQNQYLASSLLSGACMATVFVQCSDQDSSISVGLRLKPDYQTFGEKRKDEIRALQACLHLLMAGKAYKRHNEAADALRTLKAKEFVESDNGKLLLEVRLLS